MFRQFFGVLLFSELIENDIQDTTLLVQQASRAARLLVQSTSLNETYHFLHLMKLLENMLNTKEMLAGLDGGFLTKPISVNASLLGAFIPNNLYQSREIAENCKQNISFPEDLSQYQSFMVIRTLSGLVRAIESYDFSAVLVKLHKNLDLFNVCASNYSGFLNDAKMWITRIPENDTPGNNFIYEEVANPILTLNEWYKRSILNPYKKSKVTKLQLRNILTDSKISDMINSAQTLQSSITSKYSSTMRNLVSNFQSLFKKSYTNALQYLADFQIYFPDKQEMFLTRAQQMAVWRIPSVTLEAEEILSFQISENETWRVWPQYMDIQYFVDNQINNAFKTIDISLFNVIEDTLTAIDRKMLDKVNAIDSHLQALKTDLDDLQARSVVNDEFVL